MMAVKRMSMSAASPSHPLAAELHQFKQSAEDEHTHEDSEVVFHHLYGKDTDPSRPPTPTHSERGAKSLPQNMF